MPIGVADINLVLQQLLERLHAVDVNNRYTTTLGGDGEYQSLQELKDFILLTDEEVILDILSTPGNGWRQHFLVLSDPLNSGDFVPNHVGVLGDRVLVDAGSGYVGAQQAQSRDEIVAMINNPTIYTQRGYYWLEDGVFLTPGTTGKVWYPTFTRGSTCQSPQTAEPALLYGAIEKAEKINNESGIFRKYSGLYQLARGYVQKDMPIPPAEALERQLEAKAA